MLKRFLTLLVMTFLICIFILLMQLMWMRIDDLVGKGIPFSVLAEFFMYAAFTVVPLALPLAILLASLMTFGNLGENFELTAMKAAGISLFRIIRPLVVGVLLICFGAFIFSNRVLPIAESKLWALVFSLRQKSPELSIPVGEFFSDIDGITIYVRGREGSLLKDLMIYDFSEGFNNATVMTADSGRIQATDDERHLLFTLYHGESFENIPQRDADRNRHPTNIPYRREVFAKRQMLIEFDTQLNRYDASILSDQHISKNVAELAASIDSVNAILDVRLTQQGRDIIQRNYLGRELAGMRYFERPHDMDVQNYRLDSLFLSLSQNVMEMAATQALSRARERRDQVQYNRLMVNSDIVYVRRHAIQLHRKFTLSFACLIFFFIGAPLGAIIRKGGLGMPAVVSVSMFIVYYIIDNTGYKMAREGVWEPYQGMWLSSMILLPIGIFLTYKAAVDATLFSFDHYKAIWEKIKNGVLSFRFSVSRLATEKQQLKTEN